jgi:hypothetical protein
VLIGLGGGSVLQSPTYSGRSPRILEIPGGFWSGFQEWILVDSKHNISFLEHFNWFGVYLVHLVKCGYALEVI